MSKHRFSVWPSYGQIALSHVEVLPEDTYPDWDDAGFERGFIHSRTELGVAAREDNRNVKVLVCLNEKRIPARWRKRLLGTIEFEVFSALQLDSPDSTGDPENDTFELPVGLYTLTLWGDRLQDMYFRRVTLSFQGLKAGE